ncbi:tripartite tricarboxylate transporter TctB family protein [Brachybacterium sp. YJGR34]|uniref:tripartite tricarboxylate transporter TctB family protein n=1 Tax=Brachybacterium sp. YJGR34 TaxID=2059911 RepID=UPI000E0B26D6|nr:tripartite tricarboxylate transporter TctB family protein [Brachybacterium sp. YJGR34]
MTESTIGVTPRRTKPKTSDVVGTGILAVLGLVAVIMGLGYGFLGEDGQIGPGFMPVTTGAFIVIASLTEIARLYLARDGHASAGLGGLADELSAEAAAVQKSAHGESADDTASTPAEEKGEELDTFGRTAKQRARTVPLIFAVLLAALLLTQLIGMLLALATMMLALLLVIERKPVLPSVLASAAVLVAAYLIFVQMLGVPLPQGLLGIL